MCINALLNIPQGNAPEYHIQNDAEIQSRKHTILPYILHAQRLTIDNRKHNKLKGFIQLHGFSKKYFVQREFANIPKYQLRVKAMIVLKLGQCLSV